MSQPLKTGPARIALRSVELSQDKNFHVKILPVGITYTHREKFRSSALMDYGQAITVDRSCLPPDAMIDVAEREAFCRESARKITERLNTALIGVTIHSPDFETSRLAMSATRVLLPLGTMLTLAEYMSMIRLWVNVFKDTDKEEISKAREALGSYQALLDLKRVKDERVRRYAFDQGGRPTRAPRILLIAYRVFLCLALLLIIAPGLIMWSPVWFYIRRKERQILSRGPGWNDSVTEMKLLTGFAVVVLVGFIFRSRALYAYVAMFSFLRFYEEFIASARSLYSHFKFYYLFPETLSEMLRERRVAVQALNEIARERFDKTQVPDTFFDSPLNLGRSTMIRYYPWQHFTLKSRRKKDWNETLRWDDYNTMDYF